MCKPKAMRKIANKGGSAVPPGKEHMRYKAVPAKDRRGYLCYYVVDTETGERVRCYDCFLWAEHEARELNENEVYTERTNREIGKTAHG